MNALNRSFIISLDPRVMRKDRINVTSHGHTDHTPRKISGNMILSSEITRKIIEYRLNKKIFSKESFNNDFFKITLKNAGHCLGSSMVLIENKENGIKTLYTGDYNTNQKKYCGYAKPIKCDNIFVDSTYGSPKYIFPDYTKTMKEFTDYIKSNIKENIAIVTYSFGKPQEICNTLNKNRITFSADEEISNINKRMGLRYSYQSEKSNIIITRKKVPGYKNITLTGHALNKSFKYVSKYNEAFPISDHTDFKSGMEFIDKCDPEKVYTLFRFKNTFAEEIRKKLKLKAVPLIEGQHRIQNYTKVS